MSAGRAALVSPAQPTICQEKDGEDGVERNVHLWSPTEIVPGDMGDRVERCGYANPEQRDSQPTGTGEQTREKEHRSEADLEGTMSWIKCLL